MAAAILQYLAEHDQAADTAKGIARWWMGREQSAVSVDVVELALTDLVEAGVLETRLLPDNTTIYRRRGRET